MAKTEKPKPTEVVGVSGVPHYGKQSRVEDEWHPNLRGRLAAKVYREMGDNNAYIGAANNIIEQTLLQVPWKAKESDDRPQSRKQSEFLDQCMGDMEITWATTLSDILSFKTFGFSPCEKVLKYRRGPHPKDPTQDSRFTDGLVGLRGLFIRSQETLDTWEWSDDGEENVLGMWQLAPSIQRQRKFIPKEKLANFRMTANRNSPEGKSLLRTCYRSWWMLKRLEEIEAIGIERDLVGLPIIRVPQSLFEAVNGQKNAALLRYQQLVMQIRRNDHEGLVFPTKLNPDGSPSGYDIELMSSGGTRALDIDGAIRRYGKEIGVTFNTQFQQLGVNETGGSRSLSSDQTDSFALSLGALLRIVKEEFNRSVIPDLFGANGVKPEFWPEWDHGDIEKQDMVKLATAMATAANAGFLTTEDPSLERHFRKEGGLPDLTLEFEELADAVQPPKQLMAPRIQEVPGATKDPNAPKATPADPLKPDEAMQTAAPPPQATAKGEDLAWLAAQPR